MAVFKRYTGGQWKVIETTGNIPPATTNNFGLVKVDGTTVFSNNGVLNTKNYQAGTGISINNNIITETGGVIPVNPTDTSNLNIWITT